jgi:hypothetical protein
VRIESSTTSLSWIPSHAAEGLNKVVFGSGFTHVDPPPPAHLDDLDQLRSSDRFRFANRLEAWIEVEDGTVRRVGYGDGSGVVMGSTTVSLAGHHATFPAIAFPDLRHAVEVHPDRAVFVQTSGGRPGIPAPRTLARPPFVAFEGPTVWTTLALTIHVDGRVEREVLGASPFPRHWVYDDAGDLVAKVGTTEFRRWYHHAFGLHTPWGDQDSPALVTAVETALERQVAGRIMGSAERPTVRTHKAGTVLVQEGTPGDELYLLLDGVLDVEVGGEVLAELGPGAVLGERAVLEGGQRTATLRARTKVRVAVARADQLDRHVLAEVGVGHRRELVGAR